MSLKLLIEFGVAIVTLFIMITFGMLIMSDARNEIGSIEGIDAFNSSQCQGSIACNSSVNVQLATEDITDWGSVIVIVGIGVVLLGMVVLFAKHKMD